MMPHHQCTPSHFSKLHERTGTDFIGKFEGKVIHVGSAAILRKDLVDFLPIVLLTRLKCLNLLLCDDTIIISINQSQKGLIEVFSLYMNTRTYLSHQEGQK